MTVDGKNGKEKQKSLFYLQQLQRRTFYEEKEEKGCLRSDREEM